LRIRCEALEQTPQAALREVCRFLHADADDAALAAMQQPEQWPFAGHGPATAPYGLEAEVLEPFAAADLERAAATTLTEPLPWRPDDMSFAPEIVADARRYGYE
jgi:hypothetical protein